MTNVLASSSLPEFCHASCEWTCKTNGKERGVHRDSGEWEGRAEEEVSGCGRSRMELGLSGALRGEQTKAGAMGGHDFMQCTRRRCRGSSLSSFHRCGNANGRARSRAPHCMCSGCHLWGCLSPRKTLSSRKRWCRLHTLHSNRNRQRHSPQKTFSLAFSPQ